MLLHLIAQSSQPTTGSSGFSYTCLICPLIVVGLIIGFFYLATKFQTRQVRNLAAAAQRGIYEEQQREAREQAGQQRTPPPQP